MELDSTDIIEEKETFNTELSSYAMYFVNLGYYDTSFVHLFMFIFYVFLCMNNPMFISNVNCTLYS